MGVVEVLALLIGLLLQVECDQDFWLVEDSYSSMLRPMDKKINKHESFVSRLHIIENKKMLKLFIFNDRVKFVVIISVLDKDWIPMMIAYLFIEIIFFHWNILILSTINLGECFKLYLFKYIFSNWESFLKSSQPQMNDFWSLKRKINFKLKKKWILLKINKRTPL